MFLEERSIKQVWLVIKLFKSFNVDIGYVQNRTQLSLEVLFEITKFLNINPNELLDVEL